MDTYLSFFFFFFFFLGLMFVGVGMSQCNLKTRSGTTWGSCKIASKANNGGKWFGPLNWMKNRFLQLHPVGGTKSKTERAPRDSQATLNHSEHLYNLRKRGEKSGSPASLDTWPIKYVFFAKSIQFSTASSFNMHKRMSVVAVRCLQRH